MLTGEERKALVAYRIEKAKAVLVEARDNARLGHWSLVGSRLYYAVYHMAQALLLDKGLSAKTHAGTIHIIGQQFISVGLIDKTYGRLFSRLYELRQSGDYDNMFDATEEEVMPYFIQIEKFINEMEALITFK